MAVQVKRSPSSDSLPAELLAKHPLIAELEEYLGVSDTGAVTENAGVASTSMSVSKLDCVETPDIVGSLVVVPNGDGSTADITMILGLSRHAIAARYNLPSERYEALVADMRVSGLKVPIVLYQGQVLDGWDRLRACQELGIQPVFVESTGDDPRGEFRSLNQHRRHLSSAQLAAMEALNGTYANEAKHGGRRGQAAEVRLATVKTRALSVGCSERNLSQAIKIRRADPDVLRRVKDGELSLDDAEVLTSPKEVRPKKPKPDVHADCKAHIARLEKCIGITDETDPAYKLVPPELAATLREEIKSLRLQLAQKDFTIHHLKGALLRHEIAGHPLPPLETEA